MKAKIDWFFEWLDDMSTKEVTFVAIAQVALSYVCVINGLWGVAVGSAILAAPYSGLATARHLDAWKEKRKAKRRN